MSWSTLPENVREIAERELTEKQLEAFELECAGWGMQPIARHLGVTKTAIVSRLDGAHLKLEKAGVRQNEHGQWTIKKEVAA